MEIGREALGDDLTVASNFDFISPLRWTGIIDVRQMPFPISFVTFHPHRPDICGRNPIDLRADCFE